MNSDLNKCSPASGDMTARHEPTDAIELRHLVSDWQITFLTRGHVDAAAMVDAVTKYQDEPPKGFRGPSHEWWRAYQGWQDGARTTWYAPAEPNARGAFKCTVMVKDW